MQEPMSIEGYDALVEEFKYLLEVEKPKTAEEKLVAAALGDRSENADYQAAKEKLRFIDKRLFYLNKMIQNAKVIDPSLHEHQKVSFGSTVI
ncbi:MAG: transcription elongation factor GreA, partial [Epsilonproteobacteria bacterium]|nr:transcription elongation factor GreA [Campylobacterota bacterium]